MFVLCVAALSGGDPAGGDSFEEPGEINIEEFESIREGIWNLRNSEDISVEDLTFDHNLQDV